MPQKTLKTSIGFEPLLVICATRANIQEVAACAGGLKAAKVLIASCEQECCHESLDHRSLNHQSLQGRIYGLT
jgi:hypothetical protein